MVTDVVPAVDEAFSCLPQLFLGILKPFLIVNFGLSLSLEDCRDLKILHGTHLLNGIDRGEADSALVLPHNL